MDSFFDIIKLCCSSGTTNKLSTIRINHQHNSSTTEIQSSSGEESSEKRKNSNHFKPININEKLYENDNLDQNYDDINKEKVISGYAFNIERDHISNSIKEIKENKQENLIIEKNGIFTFMTTDNNNPSQRSEFNISSLFNYNTNVVILDQEVNESKRLIIQDIVGNLFMNQEIHIDASGISNGLRNKRDGVSYFGPIEKTNNITINDFIINYKKDTKCLRLFIIVFQRNTQIYYFKNVNNSKLDKNLFYLKIEKENKISAKKFFLIQECLFFVEPNETEYKVNLEMCFAKKNSPTKYEFRIQDSPITIGRDKNCKIVLDSNMYSKIHCTLYYDEKFKIWLIEDGNKSKKSTNGTWMLIENKIEINDDYTFKVGNNIFKISVSK